MDLKLHKSGAKKAGTVSVSETIFNAPFNEALVHQVLNAYMSRARAGSKAQKTRAQVRGGGKKPWRQKGTIRSPLWRGGGVTFAAKPKEYNPKVNRKMYRGALCSILSELVRQERLKCVEDFSVEEPKTKLAIQALADLGIEDVLIITDDFDEQTFLATRNIPQVDIIDTGEINPYALIGFKNVVMTRAALERVEAWLA